MGVRRVIFLGLVMLSSLAAGANQDPAPAQVPQDVQQLAKGAGLEACASDLWDAIQDYQLLVSGKTSGDFYGEESFVSQVECANHQVRWITSLKCTQKIADQNGRGWDSSIQERFYKLYLQSAKVSTQVSRRCI